MGNIQTYILPSVAAIRKRAALSATSTPTENTVVIWLNRCSWDIVIHCLPRLISPGVITPGCLQLINKLTQKEVKPSTSSESGIANQPTAAPLAEAYLSIMIGEVETPEFYASREVSYQELRDAQLNATYAPVATEPMYAWADGKLYFLPVTHNRVDYHYIEMPAKLVVSDDWPLNEGMIPLALLYVLAEMEDLLGNMERGKLWRGAYQYGIERMTGLSYKIIEEWRR